MWDLVCIGACRGVSRINSENTEYKIQELLAKASNIETQVFKCIVKFESGSLL